MEKPWHYIEIEEVFRLLKASKDGLTSQEVEKRLQEYGLNKLRTETKINPLIILLNQFKNFIIYILLFAVVFSILIGEYIDSFIILAILIGNSLIGFFQELSANKSLESLKKMGEINAKVIRENKTIKVPGEMLVPGDIILLDTGDKIPADLRLITSVRLKVEEASLTGESVPVEKSPSLSPQKATLGDRHNMLFATTSVVAGNCRAVVTETGMNTEIGNITRLIKETEEEMTPLQKRLDVFGRKLGLVILAICLVIFLLTTMKELLQGEITAETLLEFAFVAISLAVAAVPTALPAVVTIALSIGVKRLLKKKALVRQLSSVETLGSCDVICTDKTGTLTQNRMTVIYAWTLDNETEINVFDSHTGKEAQKQVDPLLFQIGMYCNNGSIVLKQNEWSMVGDPTEGALLVSARKYGLSNDELLKRVDELPFDSERKLMSVLMENSQGLTIFTKGAPGQLLEKCSHVMMNEKLQPLTNSLKKMILDQNEKYSNQALRVLGFAFKTILNHNQFAESNLVFVGLQAMTDPPRKEVIAAIDRTKQAGIRVIMITGDYAATAKSIGEQIGIVGKQLSGEELETMNDADLETALREETNIFSRVTPEHKQRIVSVLQKLDHTVAMTGDGVNDAPALKKANIGIAVGSGTDVAKEEADFVLLDDSFIHIVNAIEEGRGIYDNIQKSIMLLLSGNFGEVLIIFLAVILGLSLPLTAILLLWINMITDGAPALAYSVDPYGRDIMRHPPKAKDEAILPRSKMFLIAIMGSTGTAITLILFIFFGGNSNDPTQLVRAQTVVFNFVVLYELILTFVIRIDYGVPFYVNRWIWAAVLLSLILQGVLMYTPIYKVFRIVPLGLNEIIGLILGGIVFYILFLLYHQINRIRLH